MNLTSVDLLLQKEESLFEEDPEPPGKASYSNLRHFYTNGRSKLLTNLSAACVTDIVECKRLWKEFSPNKSIFDLWDFRFAFYEAYQYKPYFLTLIKNDRVMAVLPLWFDDNNYYEKGKKFYTWFGSSWNEDNKFFTLEKDYLPLLILLAPRPLYLSAIEADESNLVLGSLLQKDESKYALDLDEFKHSDDFLKSIKKKRRHNIRRDLKSIDRLGAMLIANDHKFLNDLVQMNMDKFGKDDEYVDWKDMRRINAFQKILNNKIKNVDTKVIAFILKNEIAAVDLVSIYNGNFYALRGALDTTNFPGIGSFVNLFEIEEALSLGLKRIDVLQEESGWKSKWYKEVTLFKVEID